jgi:hypothetical protein
MVAQFKYTQINLAVILFLYFFRVFKWHQNAAHLIAVPTTPTATNLSEIPNPLAHQLFSFLLVFLSRSVRYDQAQC